MVATLDRSVETFTKKSIPIPEELGLDHLSSPGDCIFRIMSAKDGDKRVVWNKFSMASINAAKKLFGDLIKEGMVPYKVGIDGQASSDVMKEFDANAEEVIFLPIRAVVGG